MEHIVQVLTVIIVGTLVGVEFGVAAFTNPILERLPDDAYHQARATGGRLLGTVMPFWYVGAAALLVGGAVLAPGPLCIAAVGVMAVVMVLTLTTLVPGWRPASMRTQPGWVRITRAWAVVSSKPRSASGLRTRTLTVP